MLILCGHFAEVESVVVSPSSIQAKLRDLNANVDKSKAILEQLKALAVTTAKSLIVLREGGSGLLVGSMVDEYAEQDAFKAQLVAQLKAMEVTPAQLEEVENSDRDIVLKFYAYTTYRFARNALPATRWADFDKADSSLTRAQPRKPASALECQDLLNKFGIHTARLTEHMDDFLYYESRTRQRRPEIWAMRASWDCWKSPGQ